MIFGDLKEVKVSAVCSGGLVVACKYGVCSGGMDTDGMRPKEGLSFLAFRQTVQWKSTFPGEAVGFGRPQLFRFRRDVSPKLGSQGLECPPRQVWPWKILGRGSGPCRLRRTTRINN